MRALVAILLLTLTACGFSPVYGRNTASATATVDGAHERVEIEPIVGGVPRQGQLLTNALEDRLNPQGAEGPIRYKLLIKTEMSEVPVVVNLNQYVARSDLRFRADITLTPVDSRTPILATRLWRIASFNATQQDFATYTARTDAMERGLTELGQDIALAVQVALARQAASPKRLVAKPLQDITTPGGTTPNLYWQGVPDR